MSECLFYTCEPRDFAPPVCPSGYQWRFWRPALFQAVPPGLPAFPSLVWWLFHCLRVFANRGYGILLVTSAGQVVHRSVLTPKYFRFPFMSASDLQIGDTWTDEAHRGKGLAAFALRQLLASSGRRTYWYVTEASNTPSIRVAEKAGFALAGEGSRTSRFGLRALGAYVLDRTATTV